MKSRTYKHNASIIIAPSMNTTLPRTDAKFEGYRRYPDDCQMDVGCVASGIWCPRTSDDCRMDVGCVASEIRCPGT